LVQNNKALFCSGAVSLHMQAEKSGSMLQVEEAFKKFSQKLDSRLLICASSKYPAKAGLAEDARFYRGFTHNQVQK